MGGGAKQQGVWERESSSGVQGRSPGRESGSGGRSPQKLKNFKSSYKQILRILVVVLFHTFSPIYACFSMLAGIIPLSLQNGSI